MLCSFYNKKQRIHKCEIVETEEKRLSKLCGLYFILTLTDRWDGREINIITSTNYNYDFVLGEGRLIVFLINQSILRPHPHITMILILLSNGPVAPVMNNTAINLAIVHFIMY